MAFIKFKELTKYFDFKREIPKESLPDYVYDYINKDEEVLNSYETLRDKGVFTNKKMILFDRNVVGFAKKIHIIPYKSISSGAVLFKKYKAEILISLDSGYQMRLIFGNMSALEKKNLRILYNVMMGEVLNKWK